MSKAILNIYVRTFKRRMESGETFEEILESYPKLTNTQQQMIKDAINQFHQENDRTRLYGGSYLFLKEENNI